MNQTKDGPWMLKELLGAGHEPGKRSTNPYLLGVVFERLPLPLRRRWWRETDHGHAPRDVIAHLELVAAIAVHVGATAWKCAEMLRAQEHPTVDSDKEQE
jgi:hypothetical protein